MRFEFFIVSFLRRFSSPFCTPSKNKMRKNILVVLGSTRDGREGAKIANLAMKQLKAVGLEPILVGKDSSMIGFENKLSPYTFIDPLSIGAPVLRQAIHFLPPDQEAPEWMDTLHEQIK